MSEPVRVVLVDDHTLFRMGLAELLEQRGSIKVVGVTGNADEARRLLREEKPDVLIMDLHMPPLDGLTLFRQLRHEGYATPTLMLTVSNAEEDLSNVLRAGARGYLLKDMEPDDVVDAILRASRGETVVAPAMTMKLVKLLQNDQPTPSSSSMLDTLTS
ncbi:MAG: response regulator transcription factor, partial [Sulfuricella sp.]|nr:response regulator transcription factor [Sulfuricella sp.]